MLYEVINEFKKIIFRDYKKFRFDLIKQNINIFIIGGNVVQVPRGQGQ